MQITKNNLTIYTLYTIILFSTVFLYILLLPLFAVKGDVLVVIDNNYMGDVFDVPQDEERLIVFYNGFNYDLVTIYQNNIFEDIFFVNNSIWNNQNTKSKVVKFSDIEEKTFKLYINFNPIEEINIKIMKDYSFIIVIKKDQKVELIYTNDKSYLFYYM